MRRAWFDRLIDAGIACAVAYGMLLALATITHSHFGSIGL